MAGELKLNNVSVATESGGVVSLSAANTVHFLLNLLLILKLLLMEVK